MLYFGYGSNLCAPDLSRWCRERGLPPIQLEPVGPAFLPDRRLAFTHRSSTRGGGELYVVPEPDALFAELDEIETFRGFGVPGSLYRRAIVRVRLASLDSTLAWTYVCAGSRNGSRVIASGDWREGRQP